jgi:hypothetical protein
MATLKLRRPKVPTKDSEMRPPIEHSSMSDVVLHFLYIYHKSNVYQDPIFDELYDLNETKYKKKENLARAISRLTKMNLIFSYSSAGSERYVITKFGIDCIYKLAMHRRRKEMKTKSRAGTKSAELRWDED